MKDEDLSEHAQKGGGYSSGLLFIAATATKRFAPKLRR